MGSPGPVPAPTKVACGGALLLLLLWRLAHAPGQGAQRAVTGLSIRGRVEDIDVERVNARAGSAA